MHPATNFFFLFAASLSGFLWIPFVLHLGIKFLPLNIALLLGIHCLEGDFVDFEYFCAEFC